MIGNPNTSLNAYHEEAKFKHGFHLCIVHKW